MFSFLAIISKLKKKRKGNGAQPKAKSQKQKREEKTEENLTLCCDYVYQSNRRQTTSVWLIIKKSSAYFLLYPIVLVFVKMYCKNILSPIKM